MLCPNCDGILNATGCQACGWKTGDPFPAHRLAVGTAHPLKTGADYPAHSGHAKVIDIVPMDPGVKPADVSPATARLLKDMADTERFRQTVLNPDAPPAPITHKPMVVPLKVAPGFEDPGNGKPN
jgi:hypothetical protein